VILFDSLLEKLEGYATDAKLLGEMISRQVSRNEGLIR
jgi:hypothetical protein